MKFYLSLLTALCLTLSGCMNVSTNTQGYMSIPEKFIGVWDPMASRTTNQDITIVPTKTGALITEYHDIIRNGKKGQTVYKTTLNVFAADNDRIFAIGHAHSFVKSTGEDYEKPYYDYYALEYTPPKYYKYIKEFGSPTIRIHNLWCRIDLTEKDMSLPAEVHRRRMNNRSCTPTPQTKEISSIRSSNYEKID